MKLEKKDIVCIVLLLLCALLMTLKFGGNYDTFYEWLAGEANGFNHTKMPDDSLFMVLAWVYVVTLVATVLFGLLHKTDYAKIFAYISSGSMGVFVLFGLYGTRVKVHGPFCIGMPLMLAVTLVIAYLNIPHKTKDNIDKVSEDTANL